MTSYAFCIILHESVGAQAGTRQVAAKSLAEASNAPPVAARRNT